MHKNNKVYVRCDFSLLIDVSNLESLSKIYHNKIKYEKS